MMCNRWRFAVVSLLSHFFLAAAVAFASEEATPADQPQATAEVSTGVEAAIQPEVVDELATAPGVAAVIDEGLSVRPQLLLPVAPPPTRPPVLSGSPRSQTPISAVASTRP